MIVIILYFEKFRTILDLTSVCYGLE